MYWPIVVCLDRPTAECFGQEDCLAVLFDYPPRFFISFVGYFVQFRSDFLSFGALADVPLVHLDTQPRTGRSLDEAVVEN